MSVPLFPGEFDYEIRREIMYISHGGETFCATPLDDFQRGMAKASKVIADYYAKRAAVVPLKRQGKG